MSWSTTDTLPERQHGPGWATSAPSSARRAGPGWFSLLEKVAPFAGDGVLSGTLRPRYAITVAFTGSGELTTTLALRNSRTAELTSTGDLVGSAYEIATRTAALSGSGTYDAGINDGLSAIVQAGLAAWFSGGGTLLVDTEGGEPPADGLTASLVARYLIPAYFDSVGQLIGNLGEIKQSLADLGSDGILAADTAQIYGLLGDLVGSGALSAVAFRNTFDVLGPLLGSGALSATEFAKYLTSVGFTGAGAFTALLLQIYNSTSGAGGVGTMTALIMQKYVLAGAAPTFDPTDITGCTVWLDAAQLGLDDGDPLGSAWPNLGGGGDGNVVASPAPVVKNNAPNGKPVVRFKQDEGRVRGTGLCVDGSYNLTVLYVGRFWTANASTTGRIFSNTYGSPGYYNFLVGASPGAGEPAMYDNGWVGPTPGFSAGLPSPWRVFEAVCTDTPSIRSEFYTDGTLLGFHTTSAGHGGLWNISGYDATGTQETGDCEVAELICYDRALTTTERQQVEEYLYAKWFEEEAAAGFLLAGTGILTALTSQIYSPAPALAGDGTLTALAIAAGIATAALTGSGTLTALVSQTYSVTAAFTGGGALTATVIAASGVTAALTGSGALAATVLRLHPMAAALSGGGALSATISQKYSFTAVFTGSGTLAATVTRLHPMAAALSGSGTLSATVVPTASVTGVLVYTVTIDHTKVAGDLTDFPVYIDLNGMPEGFWDAAGDGSGIRCYIGATELACEVFPTYNELHTKVPALSSSTDTVITVVPDGGASPLGSDEVWSNDYVSVYHMGDDPSVSILDSVGGYDAVPTTAGATASYGVMGYGLYLDGATTMEADLAGIVTGSDPRTMSAWVYIETAGNLTIWGQGTNDLGTLWEMTRYGGNLILHAYGGGFDTISVSAPIADATPAYCCLTYDGTTVRVYLDGNFMGQVDMDLDTGTTFNNVGGPGYFGQWADIIDEARLSAVERSAEWIETEYLNQIDPAGFYSVVESSGGMTGNGILTATATEQYAITAGFGDT